MTDHDTETALMLCFQGGDDGAFDTLYRRIRGAVYRYALRMLGEPGAAEEAAQEVLVKVYRARHSYRPQARFRTWLFRVATNHCLNEKRRAWRRHEVADDTTVQRPSTTAGPAAVAEGAQLARALQAALERLPPRQRAAVILARYEGCSMKEIGEALEIKEGAAKQLLHRAKVALTAALAPFLTSEEVR